MERSAIRPLDPLVIGKIAAGEVVERPAFAIKELIENSIDAGATAISVDLRDGGLTYFRVSDNGCGIQPADVRMAFARHATSKLRTAEELSAIHTLGFRGEALASIAAVARVEMTTRAEGLPYGIKAQVTGGVIESIQEAASPEGTAIIVRDLFFNTPARRKFLKKAATEAGLVSDLVMRLILARPDIAFRLSHAERQIYHSSGNGNLRDALYSVLGKDALASLVEVHGSAAGCAVQGFVGVGEGARSNRNLQTFLLNGRYVRNAFLSQGLEEGCRERVMISKYPICALHLTMPFEAVDVNVHPNKLEVRFQDERMMMEGLARVVRSAFEVEPLKAAQPLPLPKEAPKEPIEAIKPTEMPAIYETDRPSVRLRDAAVAPVIKTDRPSVWNVEAAQTQQMPMPLPEVPTTTTPETPAVSPLRVVCVAWYEYIFAEQDDTLYIIDQHAAHERILYERFQQAMATEAISQQLMVPQVVQLTHREHAALLGALDDLREAGFDLEDFGDRSIRVRAVPLILDAPQVKACLGDLAESLLEYRALPSQEQRRDRLVKLACRKAVKAGDPLPQAAIEGLLEEMRSTGAPPTCPHGRPLVIRIDKSELDKRFRRIVS
ncbi:MAG: DNA mismatch repair endonuclease MutL [Oscillospiraceae bacterium]|jgi:DNA mismatch repair protein MutL|nr:DNA mismatch repair endonuclease MutL [Oscillospiraceae bacterium]